MDLLRQAQGDRQLTYYGNSYGTFLGATYANLFPRRVRAMVLGSNMNPAAWVGREQGEFTDAESFLPTFLRQRSDVGARRRWTPSSTCAAARRRIGVPSRPAALRPRA